MHDFLMVIRESSQSITSKTELFMSAVEGIIGASVKVHTKIKTISYLQYDILLKLDFWFVSPTV